MHSTFFRRNQKLPNQCVNTPEEPGGTSSYGGGFRRIQSPSPGASEKYFSYFPGTPSNSLASAGGSLFWVMLGQTEANLVLISSHLSSPLSVSGLIASAGHSGSQTPQSMHSSGWMTSMFSPS